MAFLARENIALPDQFKGQLIYKWPDLQIRKYSHCIVETDYSAVFTLQGEVKGVIDQPGRYALEATELPFFGVFVDNFTGGNRFRAELYYISKRELLDKFGGPVDNVRDPLSGIPCRLFVYGESMVRVADAQKLIFKYSGSQNTPDNHAITQLTEDFLLTSLKVDVVQKVNAKEWQIYGLAGYQKEIQQVVIADANTQAADYGLEVTKLPSFTISLDDDSQAKLDVWYQRQSLVTLASQSGAEYERAAALEVQFGAAKGLETGAANTPAFLGVGLGVGQQVLNPPPAPPGTGGAPGGAGGGPAPAAPPAAPAGVACPSCGVQNAAGAKFCSSCGTSMAPPKAACPSCGAENDPSAKFCSSCGASMTPPAAAAPATATCASCGAELAPGAKFCPSCGKAVQ